MTPLFLDIDLDMQLMWFVHVKHSSISTPRNFVNFTCSSAVLSSITFKSPRAFVDVIWGVPNIMKFVLLAFIDNLLALNQLFTSYTSIRFQVGSDIKLHLLDTLAKLPQVYTRETKANVPSRTHNDCKIALTSPSWNHTNCEQMCSKVKIVEA